MNCTSLQLLLFIGIIVICNLSNAYVQITCETSTDDIVFVSILSLLI
jgi:hypothetical protein